MEEAYWDKMASISLHGRYQFTRMPFALKNSPGMFRRTMGVLLSSYNWKTTLVYLDDMIALSKTRTKHIDPVRPVLILLRNAGGTLKLKNIWVFYELSQLFGASYSANTLETSFSYICRYTRPEASNIDDGAEIFYRILQCISATHP